MLNESPFGRSEDTVLGALPGVEAHTGAVGYHDARRLVTVEAHGRQGIQMEA